MAEDLNREEPRFSRSGRVLKKTLKMKEMEDLEIKDGRQDKARMHLRYSPKHHKLRDKQIQYLVDEGRASNSTGSLNLSPSSDISKTNEFYSTLKRGCQFSSSSQKTVEIHQLNDGYSSDGDSMWSTLENTSSNTESEEKSGECLKVRFKQLTLKKNSKTNYAKFRKFPNLKNKARRKTTIAVRRLYTRIKISKPGISAFESFSKDASYKRSKNDIVTNQLALQEHRQSSEALESNPVLGTSPIDVAAHLVLLGFNLSNIASTIETLDNIRPGVYSTLLDILLCSMGPLLCLTREIAGLERLPQDVFSKILDHIAYFIPGMEYPSSEIYDSVLSRMYDEILNDEM